MTNQEKKDYLNQYRPLERQFYDLLKERGRWMDAATHITPSYSDMPKGSSTDKIQRAVDSLSELDNQIIEQLASIERARADIITSINTVQEERLRELLRYKYIDGYTFELIAVKMGYNWRWVLDLHGQALSVIKISNTAC